MNGSILLILLSFLVVTWPLGVAQCQDEEEEETVEICTPDWQESGAPAGWGNCLTLQQYINASTFRNFSDNSKGILLKLLPGRHILYGTESLMVSNTNFTLVSVEEAILDCSESDVQYSIVFLAIDNVQINSTNVIGCRFYFSDIYDIIVDGGFFRGVLDLTIPYPAITVNRSGIVNIRKWSCSDYDGGCLNLVHTTLYLSSSNFTNNLNTITTIEAPLNIHMSFFNNNRGENGGVVNALTTNVKINCSTFTNNMATGSGGVFHFNHSSLTLTSSSFKSNSAGRYGGVFFLMNANIDVRSSTLSNNTAILSGGAGLIGSGAIAISETNFLSNCAANQSNFVTFCNANFVHISVQDQDHLQSGPQDPSGCIPYDGNVTGYQNCCPNACEAGE